MTVSVAALFVSQKGLYWDQPDIDAWDEQRDARLYTGDLPVVAHPPCGRWCRMAKFVEHVHPHMRVGDDGGCFASALASVRRCGGVLEHPAWSLAWAANDLTAPPAFGWARLFDGSWVCEVSQAAYGHRAQKFTWLLYVGSAAPPPLDWRKPKCSAVVGHDKRRCSRPGNERLGKAEAEHTPRAFADLLLSLARLSRGPA